MTGKDYLNCVRGCSNTEPSDTMIFYGLIWEGQEHMSLWIKPGDKTAWALFQEMSGYIADEYLNELTGYQFPWGSMIAQPSEHAPTAPPSATGG